MVKFENMIYRLSMAEVYFERSYQYFNTRTTHERTCLCHHKHCLNMNTCIVISGVRLREWPKTGPIWYRDAALQLILFQNILVKLDFCMSAVNRYISEDMILTFSNILVIAFSLLSQIYKSLQ